LRVLITDAEEMFKQNTTVTPAVIPYEDSMHFTHTVYFTLFMILRINSHYFPTPYSLTGLFKGSTKSSMSGIN